MAAGTGPTTAERQQWEETLRNLKTELTTDKMQSYSEIFGKTQYLLLKTDPGMKIWRESLGFFDHLEEVKLIHRKLINKLTATDYPEAREMYNQVEKFYDQLEFFQSKMSWVERADWDYQKKSGLERRLDITDENYKKQAEFLMERIKQSQPSAVVTGEAHIETLELLNDLIGSL